MMAGAPGTGKSSIANQLGEHLRLPIIDKDLINTDLLIHPRYKLPKTQASKLSYGLALNLVESLLVDQQFSVILDTAGRYKFIYKGAVSMARAAKAKLKVIRCVAPLNVREERLQSRDAMKSQVTTNMVSDAEEAKWYAHLPRHTLILDTSYPDEVVLSQAIAYIWKK